MAEPGPEQGQDELARQARAASEGDRAALEALLERYLPELRAFVRLRAGRLVRARESSSDIVQSVCRDVLEHMERFQHPSEAGFKRWLFTSAMRKLINRRDFYLAEKRDVGREVPIGRPGHGSSGDAVAESRLLAAYRSFATPSHAAIVRDEIESVERAFDELSEEQREVVTLAHLVGMTRAEIAEHMGKSEGAVRVLLHRALAKIADLLAEPDSN